MSKMNTSDIRARCLAILDWFRETVARMVILKRRRTVAEPSPVTGDGNRFPQKELKGTVVIVGDVMNPVLPEENWDSLKR